MDRITPAGKLRFVRVPPNVYELPKQVLARPEQALCDFVWLNLRDGIEPQALVTFRNVDSLNRRRLEKTLRRYPKQVREAVDRLCR